MSEFVWAAGSRLTKKIADPQVVGDSLETLQQENGGRLTARVVVEAARPIEAPLHQIFEWDDLRAAELFREDQARHVLSSIRVVQPRTDPKEEKRMLHAYVSLEETIGDEKQRAYVPIARVFNDADLLKQAIEKAAAELRAFEDRYAEFESIAKAARTAREQIEQTVQTAA
jgi:hypothetical protein